MLGYCKTHLWRNMRVLGYNSANLWRKLERNDGGGGGEKSRIRVKNENNNNKRLTLFNFNSFLFCFCLSVCVNGGLMSAFIIALVREMWRVCKYCLWFHFTVSVYNYVLSLQEFCESSNDRGSVPPALLLILSRYCLDLENATVSYLVSQPALMKLCVNCYFG